MLSYETLDLIADSHNPLLGVVWLCSAASPLIAAQWRRSFARFALGIVCLSPAYGLMSLDNAGHYWEAHGWNYSTHQAVALALLVTLAMINRWLGLGAALLVCLYIPLMIYQRYHTAIDLITTAVFVGPLCIAVAWAVTRRLPVRVKPAANNSSKPTPLRGAA